MRILTKIDHELSNLQSRDPFFPPNTDTPCCLEIVPIHDHMYGQIQGNGDP